MGLYGPALVRHHLSNSLSVLLYRYMDLYESGLLRFWIKEITPQATECFTKSKRKSASQVPIRLLDLVSAFLILGTGLGLALLSFLLEFIYSKLKRNTL